MAGDASYAKVALLLHGDGANNATTTTDTSPTPKTITFVGNAKISTAQSKFGGSSFVFDGASDSLTIPASSAFDLAGGGDFTIEFFYRPNNNSSNQALVEFGTGTNDRANISLVSGALVFFSSTTGGGGGLRITGTAPATGSWHFGALVRESGTYSLYANTTRLGTSSTSVFPTGNLNVGIGRATSGGGSDYDGYIDEIRVTKGVARYSGSSITVPVAAFPDGLGEITGTITDSAGGPAARVVRAYRRDTGALLASTTSDAGDGSYRLYTPTLDEVTVLALDDQVSGTYYNDVVHRVIPA